MTEQSLPSMSDPLPLAGRKLWFVGIGGAGLSAYAQLARAWGAEVGGWDHVDTPYLEPLRDVEIELSPEPIVPSGLGGRRVVRVPVGAGARAARVPARARVGPAGDRRRGRSRQGDDRGDDRLRPRRDGSRPVVADRRAGAAARLERRLGRRLARRRRATSRTGRSSRCPPRSPCSRTSTSTTTPSSRPRRSSWRPSSVWLAAAQHVVRDAPAYDGQLAVPGELNRLNAGTALAALELAGVSRAEAGPVARPFHRHRPEVRGARARRRHASSTTTAITRPSSRRRSRRFASASPAPGCTSCSSRTSTRARAIWRPSSRPLSRAQTTSRSRTSTRRARAPIPGVTGKLIVDALSDRGRLVAWTPTVEQGVAYLSSAGAARRRRARRGRRRCRSRGRAAGAAW